MTFDSKTPVPADSGPRMTAGAFDLLVVLFLCAAYFIVPLVFSGLVLPMWGVLLAVLGYSVVPLAAFRQTLGMRFFKVELVTRDGHAVNPGDLLFRELLGRGFFPAAFLFTLVAGLLAEYLHVARFAAPTGIAWVFFVASSFALVAAIAGHALVLMRPDRRSLADLMARSFVVTAKPVAVPPDPDERQDFLAARSRRVRNVVLFEGVLILSSVFLPWVLTRKTESRQEYAERLTRKKLEVDFAAAPSNSVFARQLADAYQREGDTLSADKVWKRYEEAIAAQADARFEKLKENFRAAPRNEESFNALLEEIEKRNDVEQGVQVWESFLSSGVDDAPAYRVSYSRWLWNYDRNEAAIAQVDQAAAADPSMTGLYLLRGRILEELGEPAPAQLEYHRALLEDPDDEDARENLERLDHAINPVAPAKLKALEKEMKAVLKARQKEPLQ